MVISGRQLLPQSPEHRRLERIERMGFQSEFFCLLKLRSCPVTLPTCLICPGQMESESRIALVAGFGVAEFFEGLFESTGPYEHDGSRIEKGRRGSLNEHGAIDQCERLRGFSLVTECQQPGQVIERIDVVGIAGQHLLQFMNSLW